MSSGFVTEAELNEARRIRQEEWERVRKPDQPMEAPEVPYDGRSLFERLKEQKDKKDAEYEESHKLKNLIRGLDDDEVDFLETVDKHKINAEIKQQREDAKEMEEFRNRVANLQEKEIDEKIKTTIATAKPTKTSIATQRPSQKSILKGIVVQKRKAEPTPAAEDKKDPEVEGEEPKKQKVVATGPPMKCIGILPGISNEYSATDSEDSSDSEGDEEGHPVSYDLAGRRIEKHCSGGD